MTTTQKDQTNPVILNQYGGLREAYWSLEPARAFELLLNTRILLFQLPGESLVTRAWLQDQLTANERILEKMLCPHVTLHDGQLLLPFSPSRCACFDCLRWIDPSGTGSMPSAAAVSIEKAQGRQEVSWSGEYIHFIVINAEHAEHSTAGYALAQLFFSEYAT